MDTPFSGFPLSRTHERGELYCLPCQPHLQSEIGHGILLRTVITFQFGFPINRASQVRELAMPAVIVTVVPEIEHLAEFAIAGTVEAASIVTKHNGVPLNTALDNLNVQVVAVAMVQLPAKFLVVL